MHELEQLPIAKAEMLVRRPARDVFAAFIDPQMLTKFWLAKASAPLQAGRKVRWEFLVEGASAEVDVKLVEQDKRIVTAWDDGTTVEWEFSERDSEGTLVVVTESGFRGSADEVVAKALDATAGFTLVLSELKALLEHGKVLNLVRDKARLIEGSKTGRA